MFDMRHLRHALALADHRNFARAADALHITQPALTRSIQSLEDSLGVRLFDRTPRDVIPTAFGDLVIRHARGLEMSARDLERELHLAKGMEIGELTIGVGPYGAASMVGAVIGRLSKLYPNLRIRIVIAPWLELPMRVRAREIDLMVSDISELSGKDDLEITPLAPHRAVAVCRVDHPLTQQRRVSALEALRFPLAGPNLPQHASAKLLSQMPATVRERVASHGLLSVTCDSSSVLKTILEESNAISVLSLFMVIRELTSGQLAMVPGLDLGVQGQFGVTRLRGRSLSAPAEAFLKALAEHDQELSIMEKKFLESRPPIPADS